MYVTTNSSQVQSLVRDTSIYELFQRDAEALNANDVGTARPDHLAPRTRHAWR